MWTWLVSRRQVWNRCMLPQSEGFDTNYLHSRSSSQGIQPKGLCVGQGEPLVRGGFKPTKCCQGPHFSKPSRTSMPKPSLATPGDTAHRAQGQTTNNGLLPGTGSDSAMTAAVAPWATFPSAITATRAGLCCHKARGPVGVLGACVAGTLALAVECHLAGCSWCPSHHA